MINLAISLFLLSIVYVFEEKLNTFFKINGSSFFLLLLIWLFNFKILKVSHFIFCLTFAITVYALLIVYLSPCEISNKSIFSIILLIPYLILIYGKFINQIIYSDISSKFILVILSLSIIVNELITPETRTLRLFYENSWMGIYISPFIINRILNNKKDIYSWFSILIVSIFCFSTTFFVLMILLFFIIIFRLKSMVGMLFILLIIFSIYYVNIDSINDRLITFLYYINDNYDNPANLSSYVWLNGFSMAHHNLIETYGFGLGLNLMGCLSSGNAVGVFSDFILHLTDGTLLNVEDGSFLSAKLISEFGILGLFFVLVLTFQSIRNLLLYIVKKTNQNINFGCITGSILILVLLYVRAGGYFQVIVILSLSLLFSGPLIKRQSYES